MLSSEWYNQVPVYKVALCPPKPLLTMTSKHALLPLTPYTPPQHTDTPLNPCVRQALTGWK